MYDAVVRHGVDRSRKKHQPLGDDEVFHGVESGAQIVRKAQRQRDPQDPPVGRPDLGCGGRAERSGALKEQQRAESHRTGCAVSQGHSGTGLAPLSIPDSRARKKTVTAMEHPCSRNSTKISSRIRPREVQ